MRHISIIYNNMTTNYVNYKGDTRLLPLFLTLAPFILFSIPISFLFFSLLIQDNSSRGEHFYYAYESFHQQNKTSTIKKNCESTNIILAVVAYQFNMSGCLWEFFPYGNNNSTHKKRMIKQRLLKSFTNLNNSHE